MTGKGLACVGVLSLVLGMSAAAGQTQARAAAADLRRASCTARIAEQWAGPRQPRAVLF
jgi:hypothetical protein